MTEAAKTDNKTNPADAPMRRAGAPITTDATPPPAKKSAAKPPQTNQAPTPAPQSAGSDPKLWSAKMHIWIGMIGLLLLVGGFGVWSVFSNIAGAIIATGQIELEQNRQVVQHPDGGVVESVLVREGDSVQAGEVLIKLDT